MSTPTPPTSQGIDRLLRKAGHPRLSRRTGIARNSAGYMIDGRITGPLTVSWYSGLDDDQDRNRAALGPLAVTLTGAGWQVEPGEYVTAAGPAGGEEYYWPCLIVNAGEGPHE